MIREVGFQRGEETGVATSSDESRSETNRISAGCGRRPWLLALAVVGLPWMARADIASSTVTVEFQDRQTKITPAEPTINLAASPSVTVEIQPGDNIFRVTPILARRPVIEAATEAKELLRPFGAEFEQILHKLDAVTGDPSEATVETTLEQLRTATEGTAGSKEKTALGQAKKELEQAKKEVEKVVTTSANRVLLNFHRGWWYEYTSRHTAKEDQIDRVAPLGKDGWDIWLRNRHYAFDFPVEIECDDSQKGAKTCPLGSHRRLLVIHVDTASWAFALSAGVMFPWLRDERYRVDEGSHLLRVHPDGDVPYFVASYLHYCPVNGVPVLDAFCPTLSVGTNVPSSGIVLGLGLSGRIRPLASVNSAYLNFGGAYGPRKTLSDTYVGRPTPVTVPANTSPSSVLTTHYAFRVFFGISLGITADIDKFRGLYPGGGKAGSSETKPAPGSGK